jgi:hypothetical protein
MLSHLFFLSRCFSTHFPLLTAHSLSPPVRARAQHARYSNSRLVSEQHTAIGNRSMTLFGDDVTMHPHLAHRVMLTRMDPKRPDTPSWIESHPVEGISGVQTVTGYLCKTVDDLLRVSRILADDGFQSIVLKPMSESNGRGMMMVSNKPQNLRCVKFRSHLHRVFVVSACRAPLFVPCVSLSGGNIR